MIFSKPKEQPITIFDFSKIYEDTYQEVSKWYTKEQQIISDKDNFVSPKLAVINHMANFNLASIKTTTGMKILRDILTNETASQLPFIRLKIVMVKILSKYDKVISDKFINNVIDAFCKTNNIERNIVETLSKEFPFFWLLTFISGVLEDTKLSK